LTPGPVYTDVLSARSPSLLSDYIEWTGGETAAYNGTIPPHFFAQWSFPLLFKALGSTPWPLSRILNQGCRLRSLKPLPADEPLVITAHLSDIDVTPSKARITTRLITGTQSTPEAIVADVYAVVPLKKREGKVRRARPLVSDDGQRLSEHALTTRSGLDFALLTGDFNPIHWIGPYARRAGFQSTILHGFASLSLAWESIVATHCDGDPDGVKVMDVRFVRPLHLPTEVGVFSSPRDDGTHRIDVGTAVGGESYMTGTFELRRDNE